MLLRLTPCEWHNARGVLEVLEQFLHRFAQVFLKLAKNDNIFLRREGTKASLWLRGCPQGRPGQRLGAQEEAMARKRTFCLQRLLIFLRGKAVTGLKRAPHMGWMMRSVPGGRREKRLQRAPLSHSKPPPSLARCNLFSLLPSTTQPNNSKSSASSACSLTLHLQRLPAAISSLSCLQQPPNPHELPPHRECPLQSGSLAGPQQMASCTPCGLPFSVQQLDLAKNEKN